MSVNANSNYQYDAFISYRHSEIDKFIAKELHKQLETFKVPGKIAKKCGKKKINRIFRDKDELPITSNLADPIMTALRASEFLIVICSPRLNESLWCKREIENFIAMHGQEKVLAVLVEGEPSESFPQELLYRNRTITFENGETRVVREPVEPLAADVRGKSKAEMKKLLKTEVLRLLASMLGCHYDDLKQRHRERRMHRILALASVVCTVGLTFGTISTIMAMQIQKQKEQIDRQYWQALQNNAVMTSENSLDLLEEGDRIAAISLALEVLPKDFEKQEIPYTTEAFFALTESVQPYATGDHTGPVFQIRADAQIDDILLSDDRNKLCVRTRYNRLMVWDIVEGKKCADILMNEGSFYSDNKRSVSFVGGDKLAYAGNKEILVFDISEYEEKKEPEIRIDCMEYGSPKEILSDTDGNYIAAIFDDAVCSYDAKKGTKIAEFSTNEDMRILIGDSFIYQSDYMFVCAETDHLLFGKDDEAAEDYKLEIYYVNLKSGEVLQTYSVPYGMLAKADAGANALFVAVNEETGSINYDELIGTGYVYCMDIATGELLWQQEMEATFINSLVVPYKDYEGCLVESYATITAFYADNGGLIGTFNFGGDIVSIFPLVTPDSYVVYCRDGSKVTLRTIKNLSVEIKGSFIPATDNMKDIVWGTDFLAGLSYSSKNVIVYRDYQDSDVKQIYELEESISEIAASQDGKYSAVRLMGDTVQICDNDNNEIITEIDFENYFESMHFTKQGELLIIDRNGAYIYNMDGELTSEVMYEDEFFFLDGVSPDGSHVFGDIDDMLCVIDTTTGKVVNSITEDEVDWNSQCEYVFNNTGNRCVILDRENGQVRLYDSQNVQCLASADINATYVKNFQFSEDDSIVYLIYEDGMVRAFDAESLVGKSEVENLNYITNVIYKKQINGKTKLIFECSEGAYIVDEVNGELKVEQFIPLYCGMNETRGEYYLSDYDKIFTAPMYTYEEILGKAQQICYDNSLWTDGLMME